MMKSLIGINREKIEAKTSLEERINEVLTRDLFISDKFKRVVDLFIERTDVIKKLSGPPVFKTTAKRVQRSINISREASEIAVQKLVKRIILVVHSMIHDAGRLEYVRPLYDNDRDFCKHVLETLDLEDELLDTLDEFFYENGCYDVIMQAS